MTMLNTPFFIISLACTAAATVQFTGLTNAILK